MKKFMAALVVWLAVAGAASYASVIYMDQIKVDFTNSTEASAKASWSEPNIITISQHGLGLEGDDDSSSRNGWIQTKPFALGSTWRPTHDISVRVSIQPPPREFTYSDGMKGDPDAGNVYVRYSPDRAHWSTWQMLPRVEPKSPEEKKNPGRYYGGTVRVPEREREEYQRLLLEYSQLDVPWRSDEEALVEWILGRDPDFFSKHIPFIGYVEFLFEASFYRGQRIQSLQVDMGSSINGSYYTPRDTEAEKGRHSGRWRYEAKPASKPQPKSPTNGALPRC